MYDELEQIDGSDPTRSALMNSARQTRTRVRQHAFMITLAFCASFAFGVIASGAMPDPPSKSADPNVQLYQDAFNAVNGKTPATPFFDEVGTIPCPTPQPFNDGEISGQSDPVWPSGGLVPHPRREPDQLITAVISRYDPSLGGTNCYDWDYKSQTCRSPMASGERWEHQFEMAAACPSSFPFGTVIEIGSKRWICKDRGGAIVALGPNTFWVDLLSKDLGQYGLAFKQNVTASVWWPAE